MICIVSKFGYRSGPVDRSQVGLVDFGERYVSNTVFQVFIAICKLCKDAFAVDPNCVWMLNKCI